MIQLTMPPDIEEALTKEAERRDTMPERLALDLLRERLMITPLDFLKKVAG